MGRFLCSLKLKLQSAKFMQWDVCGRLLFTNLVTIRDAPILLFFHLFFFPAIPFFDLFCSKVSDFAYIFPNSKTQMTVLLEYLSLETALLEYLDLYNHYNDNTVCKLLVKFCLIDCSIKIFWPFSCKMCYNAAVLSPVILKFACFASILLFAFANLFFQFFLPAKSEHP